jgi:hypothetical protein
VPLETRRSVARFANAPATARFKYNAIQTYMKSPNNTLPSKPNASDTTTEIRKKSPEKNEGGKQNSYDSQHCLILRRDDILMMDIDALL